MADARLDPAGFVSCFHCAGGHGREASSSSCQPSAWDSTCAPVVRTVNGADRFRRFPLNPGSSRSARRRQCLKSAGSCSSFAGNAPTTNQVNLLINSVSLLPSFAGLDSSLLYQINLTVPAGLGTGDVPLVATVGGTQTQSGVVISLQ